MPIWLQVVILVAGLVYSLVMVWIWQKSKPQVTYVVNLTKEEAEKLMKTSKKWGNLHRKRVYGKKKPKPEKPKVEPPRPHCKPRQYLGFLHSIPKNTPIPENCLNCPKIVECLRTKVKK